MGHGKGELLAYGTLLNDGNPVRLSGQDVERGTFSHRHATVRVEDSEELYVPLQNINKTQANFTIYNSLQQIRCAWFRIWLCVFIAQFACNLGSTVWRFYERGTNNNRPIFK